MASELVVSPYLHHVATLNFVLGVVVDAAR